MQFLTPADFEIILNDPVLSENYLRHFGDFRTDYLLFDTFTPPFDNLDVRKAFAHAVNRDEIVPAVYGDIKAMPAHSMLMPGFPSSDTEGDLAEYQAYDCELANEHLTAAGYEGGEGFPDQVMMLRGEAPAACGCLPGCSGFYRRMSQHQYRSLQRGSQGLHGCHECQTDRTHLRRRGLRYGLPGSGQHVGQCLEIRRSPFLEERRIRPLGHRSVRHGRRS